MMHVDQDLGAYVLGSLDEDAAERVRAHLETCPACAAAHSELAGLPQLLDLAVLADTSEQEPLSPALEERLLDRFARERTVQRPPRRWRPWLLLGAGGALAGAAVAAALLLGVLGYQTPRTLPATQYRLALQPVAGAPSAARARAALRTVSGGTVVRLWVHNLPSHAGDVYEVQCMSKTWTASAGTFRVDADGDASVVLTTAARRGEYDTIRIVREYGGHKDPILNGKLA
jgi:predicted anti-sigma-YlaC factor YlaD